MKNEKKKKNALEGAQRQWQEIITFVFLIILRIAKDNLVICEIIALFLSATVFVYFCRISICLHFV